MGKMRDMVRGIAESAKAATGFSNPGVGHNSGQGEDDDHPGNFIKLNRGIRFHPLVGFDWTKPRTRYEAWTDLLMMAKYKPEEVMSRGRAVQLNRGQLIAARGWLAKRWLWTEHQVRAWLADLERDGAVVWTHPAPAENLSFRLSHRPSEHLFSDGTPRPLPEPAKFRSASILNVCNYSKYQDYEEAISTYVAATNRPEGAATNRLDIRPLPHPLSRQNIKEVIDINNNPPTPQGGAHANGVAYANGYANGHSTNGAEFALTADPVPPKQVRKRKTVGLHGLTLEQLTEAYAILNGAYNYTPSTRTPDRDVKLATRIAEIGGINNFKRAIAAIPLDDFFAGRVPPRPPETKPFKFHFDRLMSKRQGHDKVDVLMRLLDTANEVSQAQTLGYQPVTPEEVAGWSYERQREEIFALLKSSGPWLLPRLWRPPGHHECRFRPELIAKYRLTEIFDERGLRRRDADQVIEELRQARRGNQPTEATQ